MERLQGSEKAFNIIIPKVPGLKISIKIQIGACGLESSISGGQLTISRLLLALRAIAHAIIQRYESALH